MINVSFVITVYNKANYLPSVLAALKAQEGDFTREFVFVNDGSTDNSLSLLHELTQDMENVQIIDQDNQGVCIATNNGVYAARGTYIKLVDADDILAPFCTDLLLTTLEKTNSDFVFAISDDYEDQPDFESPMDPEIIEFEDPLYSVIDRGFARVSHCLFKKSLFEQANGCDERIFSQDHSLFIRLCTYGRLAQVRHQVCASPKEEPGRIMNNEAQVIHDATIALAYHLQDHPDLSAKHKSLAQKKIMSRIWKWASKHHGVSPFSAEYALRLAVRCGMTLSAKTLVSMCAVFRKNAQVRRPDHEAR